MRKILTGLLLSLSFLAVVVGNSCQAQSSAVVAVRPLVLLIYDEDCQIWCKQVHPVVSELEKEYGDRVTFVDLNSSGTHLDSSRKKAKELGVLKFFNDALEYVPDVAVFNGRTKLVKDLCGPKKKTEYKAAIESALSQKQQ